MNLPQVLFRNLNLDFHLVQVDQLKQRRSGADHLPGFHQLAGDKPGSLGTNGAVGESLLAESNLLFCKLHLKLRAFQAEGGTFEVLLGTLEREFGVLEGKLRTRDIGLCAFERKFCIHDCEFCTFEVLLGTLERQPRIGHRKFHTLAVLLRAFEGNFRIADSKFGAVGILLGAFEGKFGIGHCESGALEILFGALERDFRVGHRKFHALEILLGTFKGKLGVRQAGVAAVLFLLRPLHSQPCIVHGVLSPRKLKLESVQLRLRGRTLIVKRLLILEAAFNILEVGFLILAGIFSNFHLHGQQAQLLFLICKVVVADPDL